MSLRVVTAGESHGPGLTCVVEGLPAGLELDQEAVNRDMARRQLGHGRGGRMKIEKDSAEVTAGVRHGRTLGGPVSLTVVNRDYANWEERMNPWPVDADVAEVHTPRPGHADLAGRHEVRLLRRAQRARARQRARDGGARRRRRAGQGASCARSASRSSRTSSRSTRVRAPLRDDLTLADFADVDESPVRCLDEEAARAMVQEINVLRKRNESLGGVFEVRAFGARARPRLARLVGDAAWTAASAWRCSRSSPSRAAASATASTSRAGPGSEAHDEIFFAEERGWYRETNRSGGVEGGMTTGEPLVVRAAAKPLPTLTKPLRTVDIATHEPAQALRERTDSAVVPAAGVVGEAMLAIVLAAAYREKFGGDHIDDVRAAVAAYEQRIGWKRRSRR